MIKEYHNILTTIFYNPPMRISELSRKTGIDKSTLKMALTSMERRGYLYHNDYEGEKIYHITNDGQYFLENDSIEYPSAAEVIGKILLKMLVVGGIIIGGYIIYKMF